MDGKLVHHSPSITDVAREAGVSKATVSHWLNGHHGKLSPQTRSRLEAVAEGLGYHPMLGARRLSNRTPSGTVALLVRRDLAAAFADSYFTRVMQGVGSVLSAAGVRGLVVTSPPGPGEDTNYLLSLSRGIVDGFLVFDIEDHDRTLASFVRHGVAFVAVGQPESPVDFPWVATDHGAAVADAVGWLSDQGHRHIGLALGPDTLLINRHRRRGYLSALGARGLSADPEKPTAWLRAGAFSQNPLPDDVLLDGPGGPLQAWVEAPSALVGERAAQLLVQTIASPVSSPVFELHPARFHPFERSIP